MKNKQTRVIKGPVYSTGDTPQSLIKSKELHLPR